MNQVQPCKAAVPLIAEMRARWQKGQPVDAEAILAQNPELANDKDVVLDVAFEEFCLRQARGEKLDLATFSARFGQYQDSLCLTLQCHDFVADDHLYLLKDRRTIPWPEPGATLLGFDLLEQLGKGSFARVYLGREVALGNRLVVLKVSKKESAEADILGRLRHDNIVPVYSIQQDPQTGFHIVCMPYLGRSTLQDVLNKVFSGAAPRLGRAILDAVRPDSPDEKESSTPSNVLLHGSYVDAVVDMGIQLADALAFVHERHIYHRDLKPTNILVRPDGRPMLLDFNLSFDKRTEEKSVGGTLQYMAPEHLRATDREYKGLCHVDGRSDLFSLGVILYEFLAGVHPFSPIPEKGPEEVIRAIVNERHQQGYQPLQKRNPGVDATLARTVERCLAADPQKRFQTAGELAQALRKSCSPGQRLLRRVRRHPRTIAAVATALLGFAAVLLAVLALREPYPTRQYKEGVAAYQEGNYVKAVEHLDKALTQEQSVKAYLARGRARLKLGKKQLAVEDFNAADHFQSSGQTKASLAYGLTQLEPPKYKPAVFLYEKAIEQGFATSDVYQSLGFCLLHVRGGDRKALAAFQKAIALDPQNQMAYYQRARLDVKLVLENPANNVMTPEGLAALRQALALGPVSGPMHLQAARHYVLAQELEPRWKELALDHIDKAIQGGVNMSHLKADIVLKTHLQKEPRFVELLQSTSTTPANLVSVQNVQDPLRNFPN